MPRMLHPALTVPVEIFATALEIPGVAGVLGPVRETTGFYTHWPQQKQWAPYVERLAAATRFLLRADARRSLEAKLTAAEAALDEWLSADEGVDRHNAPQKRSELLEAMNDIQALICEPREKPHATHPYFARWYTLHTAVLCAVGGRSDDETSRHIVRLWLDARHYLQRARQAAYAERADQVRLAVTGALRDKLFVHDDRDGAALTVEVPTGGRDEEELRKICSLLRNEAAARHLDELALAESVEILAHGHGGIVVSPASSVKREQFVDAKEFWLAPRQMLEEEIEIGRSACSDALARLGTESLRHRQTRSIAAGPAVSSFATRGVDGYDVFVAMATGLVGMVPIVGAPLSALTGLFLNWVEGDQWTHFENSMKAYVEVTVEEAVGLNIKNKLSGFDRNLDSLLKDYEREYNNLPENPETARTLADRARNILEDLDRLWPVFFEPQSYHGTAPYFEHFFYLTVAVNITSAALGVRSYDFTQKRQKLYGETERYIELAIDGIASERSDDVAQHYSDCDRWPHNHDYRTGKDVSEHYEFDSTHYPFYQHAKNLLLLSQSAAAVVSAAQLVRLTAKNVATIVRADADAGFDAGRIENAYARKMGALHKKVADNWKPRGWTFQCSDHYGNGPSSIQQTVTHTWDELYGKLTSDHGVIAESSDSFTNCNAQPPATIFDIENGRKEEFLPQRVTLKTSTGVYLSCGDPKSPILAVKTTKDGSCVFDVVRHGDSRTYAFRAANGRYLFRLNYGGGSAGIYAYNAELQNLSASPFDWFDVEFHSDGRIAAKSMGRYWQHMRGAGQCDLEVHASRSEAGIDSPFLFSYEKVS